MKLLFLDIDGVLNSYRTDEVNGKGKTIENMDYISVGLVQKVVRETGCIICLSSDWKLTWGYEDLGRELHLPILFETPNYPDKYRVDEISKVLDGIKPEKYVILDDNEEDDEFEGMNFVKVETEDGLSYHNYLDLIEFLK